MKENSNAKSIDIRSWGHPSAPLLPKTLRELWTAESLPDWVIVELKLQSNATYADLGVDIGRTLPISDRIRNFLSILISSRADSIKDVRSFDHAWPVGLKPANIPWTQRTINCLVRRGLIDSEQKMMGLTFGDLFSIKNMGVLPILDFCCTLEASITRFESSANEIMGNRYKESPSQVVTVLEEALLYPWTEQISRKDPRFAHMLPLGRETIKQRIENILSEPDILINVMEVGKYYNAIAEIKAYVNNYEKKALEIRLIEFLSIVSRFDGERLEALADRFGCSGREPASLDECGRKIGVTRERFRQIQSKFLQRMPEHPIFMPELDDALCALKEAVPIGINDAKRLLRSKGTSNIDFHPLALLEAAKLFGRDTDLTVMSIRGNDYITSEKSGSLNRKIAAIARNLTGQSGASNAFAITEAVNEKMERDNKVDEITVVNLLKNTNKIRFLDDDWFWATDIPSNRNRLINVTNKMLCVISPQTIVSLREGIKRHYKWRSSSNTRLRNLIAPPLSVLKEFYAQHDDFSVEGNMVASKKPLDYREVLGDTDAILVETLRSSPTGLLDRRSFSEQCKLKGVNDSTVSIYLTYSPVLDHVDIDIWKLRGAMVDPAAVDAMRQANHLRPREKRIIQYGWSPEGKLWVTARIPKSTSSPIIGCPSAITKYLVGEKFSCYAKDSMHECGTIAINDAGVSYGYGTFIRRYGMDENDVLLVEFDLSNQIATLAKADEELLEEEYA